MSFIYLEVFKTHPLIDSHDTTESLTCQRVSDMTPLTKQQF